jgi:hypothetical protein
MLTIGMFMDGAILYFEGGWWTARTVVGLLEDRPD